MGFSVVLKICLFWRKKMNVGTCQKRTKISRCRQRMNWLTQTYWRRALYILPSFNDRCRGLFDWGLINYCSIKMLLIPTFVAWNLVSVLYIYRVTYYLLFTLPTRFVLNYPWNPALKILWNIFGELRTHVWYMGFKIMVVYQQIHILDWFWHFK